jgi:hypothetical protein
MKVAITFPAIPTTQKVLLYGSFLEKMGVIWTITGLARTHNLQKAWA